jgi:hypothetical protein
LARGGEPKAEAAQLTERDLTVDFDGAHSRLMQLAGEGRFDWRNLAGRAAVDDERRRRDTE